MKAFDWLLFIAVTCLGLYAVLYSDKPELMATATLFGLLLVAKCGEYVRGKIAWLNTDLQKLRQSRGHRH